MIGNKTRALLIIAGLLGLSFLTRIGFLQQELIDWDESTLVVVASSFANGHLPYGETWDLKPPMYFFILGEAMRIFGESLVTVRAVGALGWGLVGVFVYLITCPRAGWRAGAIAGALTVIAAAPYPYQPTLTEHIAVPFLMAALWLLLRGRRSFWLLFGVGVLMSCATLTRTNLAFPTLAIGFYLASALLWPRPALKRFAVLPYILGGLLPLGAVISLYASHGQLDLFITSNVWVPLSYATQQRAAVVILAMVIASILAGAVRFPDIFGVMAVLAGTHAWRVLHFRQPRLWGGRILGFFRPIDTDHALITLIGLSTLLGMTMSGFFTWHHLLQLVPFIGCLAAFAFVADPPKWRFAVAAIAILAALVRGLPGLVTVISNGPEAVAESYPIRQAAEQIQVDMHPDDKVLALYGQIVYAYLHMPPPAPIAVHPSNLVRESIEQALVAGGIAVPDTFGEIMRARPRYILLANTEQWFLDNEAGQALFAIIASDYEPWQAYDAFTVFRLK